MPAKLGFRSGATHGVVAVTKPDPDRAFWEAIYRAMCAIAAAIKKRYLSDKGVTCKE